MKLHSTIFSPKSCLSTHNSINNMTEILQSPPSHLPSTSSSSNPCGRITSNDGSHSSSLLDERVIEEEEGEVRDRKRKERDREGDQLSILTLLVSAFRKSWIGCSASGRELSSMEIGWPSNVSHVAHVTFDRFHGFLGLPVEFEPEVPRRAPSASASVFGVSTESMQLSFDARGNSVPTILLLLQRQLYAQGGLQAEGIFRINAENGQEEYVREQLNRGVVPSGVDVHCLAGLIKAWFRELPSGVLDPLSPEQVMQSQSEEECAQLVRLLPPTEAALLDWAINLMADVAQLENLNKMSARNIAMVFAPNMTQMADPLTALMYAVQVMNFLKTLVIKTLREREESMVETNPISNLDSFDDDWHQSPSCLDFKDGNEGGNETSEEEEKVIATEELSEDGSETESGSKTLPISAENIISQGNRLLVDSCPCNVISQVTLSGLMKADEANISLSKNLPLSRSNTLKYSEKVIELPLVGNAERNMVIPIFGRINSRTEWTEAWR